jgi:hypothetical protein
MSTSEPGNVNVNASDPDERHQRPPGVDDATVAAVGKLSEAFEWVVRVRGRLYDAHQMTGHADFLLEDAARMLEEAGHRELAQRLREEIVGRNLLEGRWTFQIVEEFDDGYYQPLAELEREVRDALVDGRRHVYESELKDARRTAGRAGHERRPGGPD